MKGQASFKGGNLRNEVHLNLIVCLALGDQHLV